MKLKLRSFYSRILSICLVLLGFSACSDPVDEYGSPSAKYKVLGKIVSSDDEKKPIENIRVVMVENMDEENNIYLRGDTTYTDLEGRFEVNRHDFQYSQFKIKIQDVDEEVNGLFEDIEQVIEFKNSDYKGGSGSWYKGEAQKDMGTIEMEPKLDS